MTEQQRRNLIDLIQNPPPGSRIAEAGERGSDLTLLLRRLQLSPSERLEELESAQQFIEQLREAARSRR